MKKKPLAASLSDGAAHAAFFRSPAAQITSVLRMKNDLTRFLHMEIISGGKWGLLIGVSLDTTMAQSKGATAPRAQQQKTIVREE